MHQFVTEHLCRTTIGHLKIKQVVCNKISAFAQKQFIVIEVQCSYICKQSEILNNFEISILNQEIEFVHGGHKRTHIDITVTRSGANALFPETCPSVSSVSKKFSNLIQAGLGHRLNKKKVNYTHNSARSFEAYKDIIVAEVCRISRQEVFFGQFER